MYILNQRDREFERKERAGCIMKYNKKKYTQKGDRGREFQNREHKLTKSKKFTGYRNMYNTEKI